MARLSSTRTRVALGVVAVLAVGGASALALGIGPLGDDEAEARANCDGGTTATAYAELSVEREGDALELSAEIAGSSATESWDVVLTQGTQTLLSETRTADPDGEVEIDLLVDDTSEPVGFEATSAGGTTCTVTTEL